MITQKPLKTKNPKHYITKENQKIENSNNNSTYDAARQIKG